MLRKIAVAVFLFLSFAEKNYCQDTSATTLSASDSLLLQDLKNLLDSAEAPVSYFTLSAGIGNRLFSINNNAINSKQSNRGITVFSPAAGYFHKSGLSLTAGANLFSEPGRGFGINQFSLTPAYDYTEGKSIGFGISYSRYFIKDKYSPYSSPVQNDIYSYLTYKKGWLQPGIAAGFSSGKFTEIFSFTTLAGRTFTDTGTYSIKSFSMIASLSHSFEWYELFGKDDGIIFTPSLQINLSSDSTESVSHTIAKNLLRNLKRIRRIPRLQGKNSFAAQSIGLNLDLNYSIGNFSFSPQLYLDYYLPKTDEKRFTQVFTFTFGYNF